MTLALDPKTTSFLFMDFQHGIVGRVADADALVGRVSGVLEAARRVGAGVAYVRVAFRPGYPELSDRNSMAAMVKGSGGFLVDAPDTQIVTALAPRANEPVVVKHRVGPFLGTDLVPILSAQRAETIVLCGVSTSGVVLSTVRYAADADFRIVVAADGCADSDAEVHRVLTEKVFPRQTTVSTCEAVVAALAAH